MFKVCNIFFTEQTFFSNSKHRFLYIWKGPDQTDVLTHALLSRHNSLIIDQISQLLIEHEGSSKWIAYFYLETSNFKLAQKYSFHALEVLPVARNAKFQPM